MKTKKFFLELICPFLGHRYEVIETLQYPKGATKVRCLRCGRQWALFYGIRIDWDNEIERLYQKGGTLNPSKDE